MIDIWRYLLSRSGGFDRRVLSATVRNLKNRHETLKTSIRWLLQISSKRESKFFVKGAWYSSQETYCMYLFKIQPHVETFCS